MVEREDEEQRERNAEAEAHECRAGRAHHALQVLLRRRPQVLQEGCGDGNWYPEFHASLAATHPRRPDVAGSAFRPSAATKATQTERFPL
jgi:hypothetical protein